MSSDPSRPGRRKLIGGTLAGATLVGLGVGFDQTPEMQMPQPTLFLPHGGGPFSYMELGFPKAEVDSLVGYWRGFPQSLPDRPRALLVISAHWEEPVFTVMGGERPPMLYDYYGFPPAAYAIDWPAPGAPQLAAEVRRLLDAAGFETATNTNRGFDHGTYIPLKRSFPDADIPTIQLSLRKGLDPAEHLAAGRALAPLREQGVLIVGSGLSYHNLRAFSHGEANADSALFDNWLREVVHQEPEQCHAALANWTSAPAARRVHPSEEHLMPLMVACGAASGDAGMIDWNGTLMGKSVSGVRFG